MAEKLSAEGICKIVCLEDEFYSRCPVKNDEEVCGILAGCRRISEYYESVVIPQVKTEVRKELIEKIGKIATFDKECSHTICSAEKYEEPCNLESYCPYRIWQQLKKDEEIE